MHHQHCKLNGKTQCEHYRLLQKYLQMNEIQTIEVS